MMINRNKISSTLKKSTLQWRLNQKTSANRRNSNHGWKITLVVKKMKGQPALEMKMKGLLETRRQLIIKVTRLWKIP